MAPGLLLRAARQSPVIGQLLRASAPRAFSSPASPGPGDGKPQEQPKADQSVASTSTSSPAVSEQPGTAPKEEEWTEVVHASGAIYYWNQRTGETTDLNAPRPGSGGQEGGSGGGGSGGSSSHAGAGESAGSNLVESPMADKTGTYAAMGAVIGAFLGWGSQFV